MNNLYKCSFLDEATWNKFKEENLLDEEGNNIPAILGNIILLKHVKIDEVKDEDGNIIVEAGFHTDYSVDIMERKNHKDELLSILEPYLIEAKKNYASKISGNTFKIITK